MKDKENNTSTTLEDYKARIAKSGRNFIYGPPDENSDEYATFFFIGTYEGKEVLFDAVVYTLRLKYESELYDLAEERMIKAFPSYKGLGHQALSDEKPDKREEEMGLYLAEIMMELEDEEQVKVVEHLEITDDSDVTVGFEVSLNVEKITSDIIEKLITSFNASELKLDITHYSFPTTSEEKDN